ncbi:MAG TPA: hypothetical protein VNC16_05510 [Solirubrobacterales bacterium]|jgi:hypothetical protein|nr:hypothetical protein [Solirubrobacterales bacterium]
MKPRPYVQIQAFVTAVVTLATLVVLGQEVALAVGVFLVIGLLFWLYFFARYRFLVRGEGDPRSGDRRGKDRVMLSCLFGGLVLPAALAWLQLALGLELVGPPLQDGEAVVASISLLAVPLGVFVSSSVDWYLIRPFREGVYNEPACRPEIHREGRGMDYARYWVLHRMVSELVVYLGLVVLVALFFAVGSTAIDSEEGKSAVGFLGALGIAVWSVAELSGLRAALRFVRYPHCELGSWVKGRTADCEDIAGFVLDVSVSPGVQLIEEPRGHPAPDVADEHRSIPLRQAHNIEPIDPPRRLCAHHCEFWVPDCEVGLREQR